jgi:hypothetical protein
MLIVVLVCALIVLVLALTWIRRRRPVYVGDPTLANIDWPVDIDTPVGPVYDAPAKKSFWTKGKIAGAAVFSALALGGLAYAGQKATWFRRDEDPGSRGDIELGLIHSHAQPEVNTPMDETTRVLKRSSNDALYALMGDELFTPFVGDNRQQVNADEVLAATAQEMKRNADRAIYRKVGGDDWAARLERVQASMQRKLQASRSPPASPPPSPRAGWFRF